jgi:hypothetical protein
LYTDRGPNPPGGRSNLLGLQPRKLVQYTCMIADHGQRRLTRSSSWRDWRMGLMELIAGPGRASILLAWNKLRMQFQLLILFGFRLFPHMHLQLQPSSPSCKTRIVWGRSGTVLHIAVRPA